MGQIFLGDTARCSAAVFASSIFARHARVISIPTRNKLCVRIPAIAFFLCSFAVFFAGAEQRALAQAAPKTEGAPTLNLMTEHRPPNNYIDPETGQMVGSSTLILRAVLDKSGLSAEFKLAPWSRSYATALTQANTCVYSTVRNASREAQFKWVGPLDRTYFFVVARKGSGITLDSLDDARPYRFGVLTQDVREVDLRKRGGYKIDPVSDDLLNVRKLLNDRIDLWFTDLETLERVEDPERSQMEVVLRMRPKPLYLACNIKVPDEIISAMNKALAELGATDDSEGFPGD